MKVAQTRLEARTHRPEKEACRDAPYHGLVAEVKELNNSIRQLNGKVNMTNSLRYLIQAPYIKRKYVKINDALLFEPSSYYNRHLFYS